MVRVLLTGMSGTGKSTVTSRLSEIGYMAVDLDSDEWSHWVDAAGNPTGARVGKDWVWREEAVHDLLSRPAADRLFVSGCAANMGKFLPQFDHVILLTAPAEVLLHRLATRTANPYGKVPAEAAAVLRNAAEVEPLLRKLAGHEIDASIPLQDVVSMVLEAAGCVSQEDGSSIQPG